MQIYARVDYEPVSQTSATSNGPNDVQTVSPPSGSDACAFTIESPPVRVTFDGKKPTPKHGLLLRHGDHFLPFAVQMKFASAYAERQAVINWLWLRHRPARHGSGSRTV
jgi:hypothetical protein